MAPKLNLPIGYALISLHFSGTSVPRGATMTFGVLADPAVKTPTQVGQAVKTALRASGGPFGTGGGSHGTGVLLQDIHVKFGPISTGPEATVADGALLTAGTSNESVPPNTAVLITKASLTGGRRGRGRMFLPGVSESVISGGGQFLDPQFSNMQAAWTKFYNDINTAGNGMVLLHNYDTAKNQSPMEPSTITGLNVASLVANQKNRLRR